MTVIEITLTRGQVAFVDADDYAIHEELRQKWTAHLDQRSGKYYAMRSVRRDGKRQTLLMHRLIARAQPDEDVDHWNHNTLDNRKLNLRRCTHAQNTQSKQKRKALATCHFKGVRLHRGNGKWQSRITIDGKTICLGCFKSDEEAARAYDAKAVEVFGQFAHLNFPISVAA